MKVKQTAAAAVEEAPQAATFLPLELIIEHPKIGSREIDKEHAGELKESIRRNGLDTPLSIWNGGDVTPEMQVGNKTYPSSFLAAGFHRRAALRSLKKEDPNAFDKLFPNGVPVRIFDGSMAEIIALQLRENLDRKNPTAEEIMPQIMRLRDEFKMKNKEIARRVGRSDAYISELFSIETELGSEGVEEVVKGGTSVKNALRAAKEVKAQRKSGGKPDVKSAVDKAKAKTAALRASGGEREPKRKSFKSLYAVYKSLPVMEPADKLKIAERMMAYLAEERDTYPKELKLDASKKSKTEDDDEEKD